MNLDAIKEHLKQEEGYRLSTYKDIYGNKTIGVGHKLLKSDTYTVILPETAERLLDEDINIALKGCKRLFKDIESLPPKILLVIVSMAFNLGIGGLSKFKSFISAINSNDYKRAADRLRFTLYYKQLPSRVTRYINLLNSK
jgi:lysozyme